MTTTTKRSDRWEEFQQELQLERAQFVDEVAAGLAAGVEPARLIGDVGPTAQAIARRLNRAGRHDLARPFWREYDHLRVLTRRHPSQTKTARASNKA